MELQMIKQICMEREITSLVHFTDVHHLDSIMRLGLLPRNRLEQLRTPVNYNDQHRFDGHPDSVSLSIAFPNCQMFYKLWRNSASKFCLLKVHPQVLWDYSAAFCKNNAATGEMSHRQLQELQTPDAFRGMFQEMENLRSRADQKLKPCHPTDVQAEVLIFDAIHPKYIMEVVFPDQQTQTQYAQHINGIKSSVNQPNSGFYGTRTFLLEY